MIYSLLAFFSPVFIDLLKFLKIGHTSSYAMWHRFGAKTICRFPLPLVTLVIDENKISTDESKTPNLWQIKFAGPVLPVRKFAKQPLNLKFAKPTDLTKIFANCEFDTAIVNFKIY
jgi:hypothetical protein